MRVGVEVFTLRDLNLSPIRALDYARRHRLAGVQFGWLDGLDDRSALGRVKEFRSHADSLDLYTEVAVDTVNPHAAKLSRKELLERITTQVENAAECGWHELHSWCGGPPARWESDTPWAKQIQDTKDFLKEIAPALRSNTCRLNLEPKGGLSTFDAVEIIEDVGPDVAGVCLDMANVLCFAEDPVAAARRVAPYTHMTHCKDAIIYFSDEGLRRQVRPPGGGILDWPQILAVLAEYQPDLNLSIEDHKWLYDVPIFTDAWHKAVTQLTAEELGKTVRLAWRCQQRITSGDLPDPDEYEKIPHLDEMQERLASARDYLNDCIAHFGLAGPPPPGTPSAGRDATC